MFPFKFFKGQSLDPFHDFPVSFFLYQHTFSHFFWHSLSFSLNILLLSCTNFTHHPFNRENKCFRKWLILYHLKASIFDHQVYIKSFDGFTIKEFNYFSGEFKDRSAKISNIPGTISREFLDVVFSRAYVAYDGSASDISKNKEKNLQLKLQQMDNFNG